MNIRLPFWLRQIFPLHHSTNLVEQVYRALFGERLFGKCILDRGHVHTFDKRTYNYHLDDCYHLVAADCTKRNTHAILAKEKDNVKHVMIFFENHKFVIEEPALRYTRPTTAFTVKMQTGQERIVLPLALWGSSSPSVPVGHGEVHCQESASRSNEGSG